MHEISTVLQSGFEEPRVAGHAQQAVGVMRRRSENRRGTSGRRRRIRTPCAAWPQPADLKERRSP